jgi:predicted secreted protein
MQPALALAVARRRRSALLPVLLATAAAAALAAVSAVNAAAAQSPPAGASDAAASEQEGTVLHLVASAERLMRRDRLTATLRAEAVGPDARRVQADVNKKMAAALERARAVRSVRAATRGYSVYEERPANNAGPSRWRGSQSLELVGQEAGDLLQLAGELQSDGLVMGGLSFDIAPDTLRGAEDELTGEALKRLRQRAERVAADLDMTVLRIRDMRVGNADAGRTGPILMRAMAAAAPPGGAAPAPPPAAEAGETPVQVTVEADVVLAPVDPRRP